MSENGILNAGDRLGKYQIQQLIGSGGMGEVYRAVEADSGLEVAVKVLRPEFLENNPEFKEKFLQEGQLACKISHPNVVRVIDASFDPERGLCYLVMEFVSGGSIQNLLDRGETLNWEWALTLGAKVAEALCAAEALKIVHRDIKPDNLMLTDGGEVKLADLGIAKAAGDGGNDGEKPRIVGTPAYISPEQSRDSAAADCRSDIYSLGVTLYEVMTGKMAYSGKNVYETLDLVRTAPMPDPRRINPDIPVPAAKLIMKMMAKDPAARQQTPEALLTEMRVLLDGGSRSRHRQVAGGNARISTGERLRLSADARAWIGRGLLLLVLLIALIVLSRLEVKPWRAQEIAPVDAVKVEALRAQAQRDHAETVKLQRENGIVEKRLNPPPCWALFDALFRESDGNNAEKYLVAGIWSSSTGKSGELARWFEQQRGNYLAPPGTFRAASAGWMSAAEVRLAQADALLLAEWATDADAARRGLALGILQQMLELKGNRGCAPGAAVAAWRVAIEQATKSPDYFEADSMLESDLRQLLVLLRAADCADGIDALEIPAGLKPLRQAVEVTRP